MNPKTGNVWESLQPQGTLDRLTIQLRSPGSNGRPEVAIQGQKWPRRMYAPDPGLLVKPRWLPYRVDHVTGMFNYRNGQVALTGLRGQHGKTVIRLDGTCFFPMEGPWDAKLTNLTIDRLRADHELLTALPLPIRKAVEKLNVTGPLMLRGQLQLAKAMEGDRKINAQWDLKITAAGATLDSGVRLDHIHGGVRLFGLYDNDGILRFVCRDREACLAYAELFDLSSIECSLMNLPEPGLLAVRGRKKRTRAKNSN